MDLVVAEAEDMVGLCETTPLAVSTFVNGISPLNLASSSPEGSTRPNSTCLSTSSGSWET